PSIYAYSFAGPSTLDAVTLGDSTHPSLEVNTNFYIANGLTLANGVVVNLGFGTWGFTGNGTQSLSSAGVSTVLLTSGRILAFNAVPGTQTLQIGAGVTIQGYGSIGDAGARQAVSNLGTIIATANTDWDTLSIIPGTFNNSGILGVVANGTLTI